MRHVLVAVAFVLMILVSVVVWSFLSSHAVKRDSYAGRLTVVLPWHWSAEARIEALLVAGAIPIRASVAPGAIEVDADMDHLGLISRLERAGAWLVIGALPADMFAVGGCSYLSLGNDRRPPVADRGDVGLM